MNNDITSAQQIKQIADGFRQSRILLTAFELRLFTILDKKMLTAQEIAELTNTNPRAVDRLMNALTAFGLLHKKNGKFFNSFAASEFLVAGKKEFMGNLAHSNHLWKTWSNLTESVKTGTSDRKEEINDRGDNWLEAFIEAMHYRGEYQSQIISKMIDLTNVNSILDIGGGSGVFAYGFINEKPDIKAVIFDLPNVIPITQKFIDKSGFAQSVTTLTGNFLTDSLGDKYDMIFLSAIVHMNSFDENKELIIKCADHLNPGGQIIIQDWVMDDDRISPAGGSIFAINMLVGTKKGDTYTESEMKEWFADAGIQKTEKKTTGFGSSLMIGWKEN